MSVRDESASTSKLASSFFRDGCPLLYSPAPAPSPLSHVPLTALVSHSRANTVVVRAAKQLHFNKNGEALKRMQVRGRRERERERAFLF